MPPTPRWRLTISPGPKHLRSLEATRLRPTRRYLASLLADEGLRWTAVCDMAVAPLAEGVIFRSCLLPPLLAACRRADESAADDGSRGRGGALSPASASWIAPLFFGVAHAMRSNRAPYGLELFWVSWCSGRTRRSSGPTFPTSSSGPDRREMFIILNFATTQWAFFEDVFPQSSSSQLPRRSARVSSRRR
jgi:hypothetical protein